MNKKLIHYADNPTVLKKQVDKRLSVIPHSLNELCVATGISGSTFWRWGEGSEPQISTIKKVELQLKKWERKAKRLNKVV